MLRISLVVKNPNLNVDLIINLNLKIECQGLLIQTCSPDLDGLFSGSF